MYSHKKEIFMICIVDKIAVGTKAVSIPIAEIIGN